MPVRSLLRDLCGCDTAASVTSPLGAGLAEDAVLAGATCRPPTAVSRRWFSGAAFLSTGDTSTSFQDLGGAKEYAKAMQEAQNSPAGKKLAKLAENAHYKPPINPFPEYWWYPPYKKPPKNVFGRRFEYWDTSCPDWMPKQFCEKKPKPGVPKAFVPAEVKKLQKMKKARELEEERTHLVDNTLRDHPAPEFIGGGIGL
eukprot:TRINITY_DN58396_c0_g1_i1.p2 TRINITY_DN58396_c0_g1~~TRINITY_DN58396_c0_g1_i1.p2  ORF type:complete len:199 (-),score=33.04 TRINITY_DN58396_c0_g1_i1:89-685(-)